jgi:hypothetical protein
MAAIQFSHLLHQLAEVVAVIKLLEVSRTAQMVVLAAAVDSKEQAELQAHQVKVMQEELVLQAVQMLAQAVAAVLAQLVLMQRLLKQEQAEMVLPHLLQDHQ